MTARCGGGEVAWVAGVLAAPIRGVGGWGSRKYSSLEGCGNQYWPLHSSILAWRAPPTEKPGRPHSTASHRVEDDRSDPAHIDTNFFFFFLACGSSAPVRVEHEGGVAAWLVGTLAAQSVQGHGLPLPQELWPYPSLFCQSLVSGDQTTSWASLCSSAHSGGAPLEGSLALGPSLLLGASGTQRPPPAPDWGPTL